MPSLAAEGTTFTYGTPFDMVSISVTQDGSPVEVTALTSAAHLFINGIPDYEITAELKGSTVLTLDHAAAVIAIVYNDGNTINFGGSLKWIVTKVDVNSAVGGTIDMTVVFKPTPG